MLPISSSYAKHRRNRLSLCLGSRSTCLSFSGLVPGKSHFSCVFLFIYPEKQSDSDLILHTKPLSLVKSLCVASLSQWSAYQMIRLFRPAFVGCRDSHSESLDQGQGHYYILLDILHVAYIFIVLRDVLAFRPFLFLCLSQ